MIAVLSIRLALVCTLWMCVVYLACTSVRCRMYCRFGWAKDNITGCDICACRNPCHVSKLPSYIHIDSQHRYCVHWRITFLKMGRALPVPPFLSVPFRSIVTARDQGVLPSDNFWRAIRDLVHFGGISRKFIHPSFVTLANKNLRSPTPCQRSAPRLR